jgi:ATPase subunit of ABC transporter with duplicated ATPase domains
VSKKESAVVIGHNIGYRRADGSEVFSGIEFSFAYGASGILSDDRYSLSILGKIISGELTPSEGSITRTVSIDKILVLNDTSHMSLAEYLGVKDEIEAREKIENGVVEDQLFEVLAENWDIEERIKKIFSAFCLIDWGLKDSVDSLSKIDFLRLQLAAVELKKPEIIITQLPSEALVKALHGFSGALIVLSSDAGNLSAVKEIWELTHLGLRCFKGGASEYLSTVLKEERVATETLAQAERALQKQIGLAEHAAARQAARSEHAKKYADTGVPKTHRGNLKRRSQETLGKLNQRNHVRIEEAEERVRQAEERVKDLIVL